MADIRDTLGSLLGVDLSGDVTRAESVIARADQTLTYLPWVAGVFLLLQLATLILVARRR